MHVIGGGHSDHIDLIRQLGKHLTVILEELGVPVGIADPPGTVAVDIAEKGYVVASGDLGDITTILTTAADRSYIELF